MKKEKSVVESEDDLIKLTRGALFDVLGREPTKQEILRAHAGFKRMAFIMFDHLEQTAKRG